MAHSLELRVPYLDREVWKAARAVPSSQKMRGKNITKYPLRLAAVPLLPEDWIKREKKGFPVPFIAWLREEKYYNWARELISQDYVGEFFDVPYLLDLLDQHYSGKVKTTASCTPCCPSSSGIGSISPRSAARSPSAPDTPFSVHGDMPGTLFLFVTIDNFCASVCSFCPVYLR